MAKTGKKGPVQLKLGSVLGSLLTPNPYQEKQSNQEQYNYRADTYAVVAKKAGDNGYGERCEKCSGFA